MILVSLLAKVLVRLIVALIGKKLAFAIAAGWLGIRAALASPAGPGLKDAATWLRAAWRRATRRARQQVEGGAR